MKITRYDVFYGLLALFIIWQPAWASLVIWAVAARFCWGLLQSARDTGTDLPECLDPVRPVRA